MAHGLGQLRGQGESRGTWGLALKRKNELANLYKCAIKNWRLVPRNQERQAVGTTVNSQAERYLTDNLSWQRHLVP